MVGLVQRPAVLEDGYAERLAATPQKASAGTSASLTSCPVIAAIPAYNEARFIGSVVLQVRRYADVVLVIDDGSRDQTAELAEAAGATVLRHNGNLGKGGALNTAFAQARLLGARCLVLVDGDGQHLAEDIPEVIRPVLDGKADMAVGSRFLAVRSEIPSYRKVGQHGLTLATNLTSGVRLTDSQSGFRAFSPAAIAALSFRGMGFSVESEMQFLMREHKLRVVEVPIGVVYAEPAKRNPVAHGMAVLNGIIQLVSQGRPLFFFGMPGSVLILLGFLLGLRIVATYNATGALAVGYAILVLLLMTIGILSIFTGIILHAMRLMLNDMQRIQRAIR